MAKVDVRKAYRNIPVCPADRLLLGMIWKNDLFVDTTLPFGLRSAPKIFSAVADAAEWIIRQEGTNYILHYLDDYLVVGAPGSNECARSLDCLLRTFEDLGLPVALPKLEGPSTCLTFLGIEIDTRALEIRLPDTKLQALQELIRSWLGRESCEKRALESLIGSLSHACGVVRAGKTFMRRMFQLLSVARKAHHRLRLNQSYRSDLFWWHTFLAPLNHASFFRSVGNRPARFTVYGRIR